MLRWLTAGESHGPELVAILEGLPAGIPVSLDSIRADLARRKLGYGRGARMKFEQDELAISGGVRHGESLGSPIRLKLYRALVRAGADGLPVGALQAKVGIAASTLSHHIRTLKEAGLVAQERQATTLICRANYPAMNALLGYLVDECCMDACQSKEKAA